MQRPSADQRSTFIAEYAAKKQSQMERARQLREQRAVGNAARQSNDNEPPTALPRQVPQPQQSSHYDELPARAQQLRAPHTDGFPPLQSQQPHGKALSGAPEYPPPIASSSYGNREHRTVSIEVTETHFREATQRGIITPDQARQLWAVLSDQATSVAPTAPTASRQPQPQQPQYGSYDPRSYAAPVSSGSSSGATYRGSYVHQSVGSGALDDDEQLDSDPYNAPRLPTKLSRETAAKANPVAGARSKKPEWNNDFSATPSEPQEATDAAEYGIARGSRPRAGAGGGVTASRSDKPEWNSGVGSYHRAGDDGSEASAGVPSTRSSQQHHPVASRRQVEEEVVPLEQMMPPKPQQQQHQRNAAPRGAPAATTTRPTAPRAAAGRPHPAGSQSTAPPPPPVAEPVQSPEEIAAFLQQKEAARRQFEGALHSVDGDEDLIECNICGRKFREKIIDRHEAACKNANKKRKVFDSKGSRLNGIDGIEEVLVQQRVASRRAPGAARSGATQGPPPSRGAMNDMPANKMPKWKLQHQQFQAALAAARGQPGMPVPEALDDRVPCPHCSRKFAAEAAERHIPHCAKTVNKPKGLVRPGGRR